MTQQSPEPTPEERAREFQGKIHRTLEGISLTPVLAVQLAQLNATLAVLDELQSMREAQFRCPHGNMGFCPYCMAAVMRGEMP